MQIRNGAITAYKGITDSGSVTITGSLSVSDSITGSNALFTGTITAQTLVVQVITSSVDFVTGSTRFGSLSSNTHQFTGSVSISGSLSNQGPITITNSSGTGSIGMTSSTNSTITLTGFYNVGQTNISIYPGGSDSFIDTFGTGNRLIIRNNSGISLTAYSSATQYMHMGSTGVRIGGNDQTISARLHVSGSDNSLFLVNSTTAGSVFYISGSGNVGIGTTSPSAKLRIANSPADSLVFDADSSAFGGRYALLPGIFSIGTLGNGYPEAGYNFATSGSVYTKIDDDTAWGISYGNSSVMSFKYAAAGTGTFSWNTAMVINLSGSVGIGTTSPAHKLDVSGSARVTSSLFLPGLTTTSQTNVVTVDTTTGQLYYTASSAFGGGGVTVSGTYTPTLTAVYNVASIDAAYELQYMRIGNVVTVGGYLSANATATNTWTRISITLPISSTFDFSFRAGGGGGSGASNNLCSIQAGAFGATVVYLDSYPNTTSNIGYAFSFTYLIM